MEYMKNTSYFFVPFKYEKYERFKDLTRMLDESDSWDLVHDEIIYMMKYVADKLDSRKPEQCLCFHYEWNGRKREDFSGLKDWFSIQKAPVSGDRDQLQVSINRNPALLFQYFCMYYGISGTV